MDLGVPRKPEGILFLITDPLGAWWDPGGARGTQGEPGGARRTQGDPGGARRTQEDPGGATGSQEDPEEARRTQGTHGGARGELGGPRRTQGESGGPSGSRGGQEHPGGARRTHRDGEPRLDAGGSFFRRHMLDSIEHAFNDPLVRFSDSYKSVRGLPVARLHMVGWVRCRRSYGWVSRTPVDR